MIPYYRGLIESNQPIIVQPMQINNVFGITPGERILEMYECDQTVCGYGPTYTVTLSDARIIQRFQDHMCCCTCTFVDSMLFLSDISSIKNSVERRCFNPFSCAFFWSALCFPITLLCCFCSCLCAKDIPVPISLKGAFGTEVFTFSHHVVSTALANIPAAAMPHKISGHRPINQML